jgi:hypothetical protein
MLRTFVAAVLVLVIFVGGLLAAEGVVVKNADKDSVTVRIGDKEKKIELKGVKILKADGKEGAFGDLKKDAKVDVTEKDGKVTEIKIKK